VSKTVIFDLPSSFMLGMLIPLACPEGISSVKNVLANRYFLATVLFELFFFIPLGAYLFAFYPAWSMTYFLDPASFEADTLKTMEALALFGYLAANVGGFLLAAKLAREGRRGLALAIVAAVAAALAIFSLVTFKQIILVGSYADWKAIPRACVPIFAHRIGYVIGLDGAAAAAVLLLLLREFRQEET